MKNTLALFCITILSTLVTAAHAAPHRGPDHKGFDRPGHHQPHRPAPHVRYGHGYGKGHHQSPHHRPVHYHPGPSAHHPKYGAIHHGHSVPLIKLNGKKIPKAPHDYKLTKFGDNYLLVHLKTDKVSVIYVP